jgi:hypothetical protein
MHLVLMSWLWRCQGRVSRVNLQLSVGEKSFACERGPREGLKSTARLLQNGTWYESGRGTTGT